ncbi:MAG: M48 family metallopeptidase [Acidobacteriota bacterium]|nr:M48 family metallopeptidase [Acidobacteriota bacterium]
MRTKLLLLISLTLALSSCALAQDAAPSGQTAPATDSPAQASRDDSGKPQLQPPAKQESAEEVRKEEKDLEFPHDGKTDDISAIGNRNVGCSKGLGNWYSLESQVRMGKSFAAEVERSAKVINDPVVSEYINRIAQNIVRNSDAKVPFTVKVLDDDEVNAFALPGGYFYVQSGLILAADNEAELAGVMAHEIGHVAACHAARQVSRGNMAQIASIPLIFLGGGLGYGLYEAAGLGVPVTFLKFQRNFEAQADYLGVQYLYASGYDPQAFPQFFEKIQALEKKKPGVIAKAFETHPPTPARMEHTQKEIATILPPRPQYVVDTSEFQDIKARLAKLENRRKLDQDKDKGPSLRRANTQQGEGKEPDPNNPPDGRPTLKRHD